MDPIHQFHIQNIFSLGRFGETEIAFTNSALFMVIALVVITALMVGATSSRSLVPSRMQAAAEVSYEFVATMLRSSTGPEGMRFFPFVFSIFMFVVTVNMFGLIPYSFTVTSHIVITVALALLVFLTVTIYGLVRHGLHFFKLFVPSGIPGYILPMVVAIEIMSYLSRPVSHSVRLFANMLAGHITIQVFAGFVILLGGIGLVGWFGAILPLAMTIALFALETLVAFLQAYVFAILTCIYLNDALHPGH